MAAESASTSLHEALKATPDPEKSEKKFLAHMHNNGANMNSLMKYMEKHMNEPKHRPRQWGVDLGTVDTGNVGKHVEENKECTLTIITLNTPITLLRAATLRTNTEVLTMATNVYKKFDDEGLVLLPKYRAEVEDILSSTGPPHKKARTAPATPKAMP